MVGLGNPGLEYQWTPHNAGFMAIDRIAQQEGVVVQNRRCRAATASCRIHGREVVLAKPETFMNLSGASVAALVREFEADPARDVLVIYDELDLTLAAADALHSHLRSEYDNGRVLRLLLQLGLINERPEYAHAPQWSETGDRYVLKLFRDYLFHQTRADGGMAWGI